MRVTVQWKDLPVAVTAYHTGSDGVERAVRKQRMDVETMILSRVRPGGQHHWDDQNRIIYEHLLDTSKISVEMDVIEQ